MVDDGFSLQSAPEQPETISELAASCVRFVQGAVGVQLDFTHETLPVLDHYLRTARSEVQRRPEATELLTQSFGAYFGMVLAAGFGGLWRVPSADVHEWFLYLQPAFLALNPIGVAYDVLLEGGRHDGPSGELRVAASEQALIAERLQAMPLLPEDEYYTFVARYEAFQVCFDTLRGEMERAGLGDVTFELGDYLDEFDLG